MKQQKGFTLIELMVVGAVLAILMTIAIPAFNEQTKRARRADGKAFIMDIASRQERFYTQYSTYTNVLVSAACTGLACGLNYSQNISSEGFYTAAMTLLPNGCTPAGPTFCTRYTITATPIPADPKCTTLTLTSTGVEGYTGSAADVKYCWR